MGFRELNGWPEFSYKGKHYRCMCQIDEKPLVELSAHQLVTSAHYSNGNLKRLWKAKGGTTKEIRTDGHSAHTWWLDINNHQIELTVEYIDPREAIDATTIGHQSGYSEQSEKLLKVIMQRM